MAANYDGLLPTQSEAIVDARGVITRKFRDFLAQFADASNAGLQAQIDELARLIAELDDAADIGNVLGQMSIRSVGTLTDGNVLVTLQNDVGDPGPSYYYGTDASGAKGFWPALANPMTTLGDVITGDVDGVPIRLGIGATDQVLGESGGVPAYVDRVIEVQPGTGVTVDSTDPMRPIVSASASGGGEGGIGVSIGTYLSTAPVLPVATEATSIADAGYDLTGEWFMWCYPSGSIEIDVWKDVFGTIPVVADSICGGTEPAIVGGTFASGTFTGPITIDRTDTLLAHINSNTSVKWVKLLLIGDKT